MSKRTQKLYLLAIFAIAILLRLPVFFNHFVNIDENEYAMAAQKILAGGLPYRDFLIYHPPAIYYFYALAFVIFGASKIWAAHVLTILVVVATCYVIYKIGEALHLSRLPEEVLTTHATSIFENHLYLAPLMYAVFSTSFKPTDMFGANCEILAALPISLGVWSFLLTLGDQKSNKRWFYLLMSGFFFGVALLVKYQAGILLVATLLFLLLQLCIGQIKPLKFLSSITIGLLGLALSFGAVILSFYLAGIWQETYDAWTYILLYAKGSQPLEGFYLVLKFLLRTSLIALSALFLWLCACAQGWQTIKIFFKTKKTSGLLYILFWAALSFVPVVVGGRMFYHYYLWVIPSLTIFAGVFAANKWETTRKTVKIFAIFWTTLSLVGWPTFAIYWSFKNNKSVTREVSNYLAQHAKEDDSLFVWGYAPQIYIGSGLKPSTRFTTADYLTGRSPATDGLEYNPKSPHPPSVWQKIKTDFTGQHDVVIFDTSDNIFPRAWQYLKEDLDKTKPTFIVDSAPSNYRHYGRYPIANYPLLQNLITQDYHLLHEIEGFRIYQKNDVKTFAPSL